MECIWRHAYPGDDPGEETMASYAASFFWIPRRIKRMWGWSDELEEAWVDEEFEFLRGWTLFEE